MIYVPFENITDFKCYTIYDKDTIRAYVQTPQIGGSSNYTDYYVNSHYLSRNGTQQWGQYTQSLPVCVDTNKITNDFYYRNDLSNILTIFLILCIFCVFIPYKIFSRAFGRWFKV